MNNIDWTKFEVKTPAPTKEAEEVDFAKFEVGEEKPELGIVARTAGRQPARLFSSFIGLLPDLAQAAHAIPDVSEREKTAFGFKLPPELAGDKGLVNLLKLLPKEKAEEFGSKALMEKFHETTEGQFRPQTKTEEVIDEVLADFAALALPIKGKIPFARAIGMSIGANLAKEGVTLIGAGPKTQTATKLGSLFLLGAVRPNALKNHISDLYKKSTAAVPEGAFISGEALEKSLRTLKVNLKKGVSTPSKSAVLKPTEELLKKIEMGAGTIRIEDLIDAKRSINELMGDPALLRRGKNLFKHLAKNVDSTLKNYGKENKSFLQAFTSANEAWGATAQSKKVSRFITKHKNKLTGMRGGTLIAIELLTGHPKIAAGTLALGALIKGGELLARINANPTLRKHYLNVIKNSLEGNAAAMVLNMKKLDSELNRKTSKK